MKYRITSGMNSASSGKNNGASERKRGEAGELAKWNPRSETDPMVVVASPAEVRCGCGAQKGVQGNSGAGEPVMFRRKGRKHRVDRCEEKPTAWTVSYGIKDGAENDDRRWFGRCRKIFACGEKEGANSRDRKRKPRGTARRGWFGK